MGFSYTLVSAGLVLIAIIGQSTLRRPHLSWLLWAIAIIKLIAPPLVILPVLPADGIPYLESGLIGGFHEASVSNTTGAISSPAALCG